MRSVVLVAHNLRSSHNVGSLLRTADGLGVRRVILSGYTPYPTGQPDDERLPHIARKTNAQIQKTALGAEQSVSWKHVPDIFEAVNKLRKDGYLIYALEQTPDSKLLTHFQPPKRIALIVGREVEGLEQDILAACDGALEIPMQGQKESFNVAQAAAMALYHVLYL